MKGTEVDLDLQEYIYSLDKVDFEIFEKLLFW